MKRIDSLNEFESLRKSLMEKIDPQKRSIVICGSTGCSAFGAKNLIKAFEGELKAKGLEQSVNIKPTGCHGFCERGPIVVIHPQGIFYQRCKLEHIPEIISKTILKGEIIDELLYEDPTTGEKILYEKDIPFYKRQKRIVLANNGKIDPTSINDYIAFGGYQGLGKALSGFSPEKVIEEIKYSGLGGRGGAGFSTGLKWENTRKQPSNIKYVICNADEGDPGAYMDRSILESNPHAVIEGMIIGAYAIGACEGWIYVRNEYPLAVEYISLAVETARELGLLGDNILGSGFSFDIKIAKGAGAFVCGEETALIASIEGKRGVPRQKPPFPSQCGLFGKPTNINNVETWANVPIIMAKGAEYFRTEGTKDSKGTKIFSLVGKVQNTGLVEVPIGATLHDVIMGIGGGAPNHKKVKAVQIGGPSGGCIPAEMFHLPIDYKSLTEAGAIMGSGGMIVMDENSCMVDLAKYFTNFLQEESCGKCVTCREGIQRMHEILGNITAGCGTEEDLALLEELAVVVKDGSMCGLGQTASNPFLATLRYFKEEYRDHIIKKKCQAAVCKEIISSPCQHTCPIDTEVPVYLSLIASGKFEDALAVIKKDNPLTNTLSRVCNHPCESKCRAGDAGEPLSIRNLKRFVADYGLKNGLMLKVKSTSVKNNRKVAIIGSGPAGLSSAFCLAQNGYQVTIFEKFPVAGGMLAVAIPEYRLPREALKADIEYIKSSGVEIQTNKEIGKDLTIEDLYKQGFEAVFIATGAHKSIKLNIPGEEAIGVSSALKVLNSINLGKEVRIGKRVGIIGGGNSAIDACRAVLRAGTPEKVTVFYRRTMDEMPAFKEEIQAALEEGVKIEFLTAPTRIVTENGKLTGCEFVKMRLGDMDKSGRRSPVPIEGSEFTVELDTLLVAIGERPDTTFLEKEVGLTVSKSGALEIDPETFCTGRPGIFAGGDLTTGPNTVVNAVAAGKIAAKSIMQYLSRQEVKREYKIIRPSKYIEPVELTEEETQDMKRALMPCLSPEKRKCDFSEIEQGLNEEQAVKEARRCLRCDLETRDGQQFLKQLKETLKV